MSLVDRRCGSLDHDFLSLAFEASDDCIMMLARDGTLLAINAGGAALMDFHRAEGAIGLNWLDFWPEDDRARASVALEAARTGQRPVVRGWVPNAGSSNKYLETTILPVPGMNGLGERLLAISRDITESYKAERALNRSARMYQALVEASSEIVWHFDVIRGVTERRGYEEFTGDRPPPADEYGWLVDIHPDDVEASREIAEQATLSGDSIVIEYRLRHKSGGWRWVEDRARPIVDQHGVVTDWIGMITDIHDRKSAEQALRQSEERLLLALESADLGTWDLDVPTGERTWSDEAKRMFGLPVDTEIVTQTLLDLVHPDDRDLVEKQRSINSDQRDGTTKVSFRAVHPHTGEVRWIVACGRAVLDDQGNPMRRVGTFLDYTERKATQDALRLALRRHEALLRATSDIVWFGDSDQEICGGRGWSDFTGHPQSEADGAGWLDFVHPEDRPKVKDVLEKALATNSDYANEYRLRHVSGQWRWVIDRAVTLMSDDGGRIEEWAGTITDIHDRKIAETALQKSEEHLRLAIDATALGTWDVNLVTGEREWSPEFFDLLDLPRDMPADRELFLSKVHPDDRVRIENEIDRSLESSDRSHISVFRLLLSPGVERWVERHERLFFDSNGAPVRRVGSMRDISDRRQAELEVWTAAHTDALTGVANRALFQTRLDQAVSHATEKGLCVGLFIVDLDRFKDINDFSRPRRRRHSAAQRRRSSAPRCSRRGHRGASRRRTSSASLCRPRASQRLTDCRPGFSPASAIRGLYGPRHHVLREHRLVRLSRP